MDLSPLWPSILLPPGHPHLQPEGARGERVVRERGAARSEVQLPGEHGPRIQEVGGFQAQGEGRVVDLDLLREPGVEGEEIARAQRVGTAGELHEDEAGALPRDLSVIRERLALAAV